MALPPGGAAAGAGGGACCGDVFCGGGAVCDAGRRAGGGAARVEAERAGGRGEAGRGAGRRPAAGREERLPMVVWCFRSDVGGNGEGDDEEDVRGRGGSARKLIMRRGS